ncbi:MAG: D-aminoacylase [Pedosphaera sp.]|nr:D-aminoacylase [Pedosphaera sp.]
MKPTLISFIVLLNAFAGLIVQAETFDLVIRHGRIIDGMGNPAFFGDVGIKNGRISRIGKVLEQSQMEINATGLIVAPGFIDVHTHAEEVCDLPLAENFVRMGVTTLVLGNCGFSGLNMADFFRRVEATNISVNVATLIGHGAVRGEAMGGSFMRPPTAIELTKMRNLVDQAMKDGAVGISTGLIYLPGTFAKTEEIIELAKVASSYGGIYASHMRDEGLEVFKALDELFMIARQAAIPAHISHIKLSGRSAWGQADKVIEVIERARAEGLDITQDQYLYTASSTGISQLIPEAVREGNTQKFVERLQDPETKMRLIEEMRGKLKRGGRDDYSYAVIAYYRHDPSLNGKNIAEAAKAKRGSDALDEQIELIFEIQKNGGASGVFHGINEDDLKQFARHPNTMFASDSGIRRLDEGVPHPRGYGNNARLLSRYVRELQVLRLEEAIRRMTALPAATFRLKDRGLVREGCWADLVIFDPAQVRDNATFADPHHYATGLRDVIVNGQVVVRNERHIGTKPGKALRLGAP